MPSSLAKTQRARAIERLETGGLVRLRDLVTEGIMPETGDDMGTMSQGHLKFFNLIFKNPRTYDGVPWVPIWALWARAQIRYTLQ